MAKSFAQNLRFFRAKFFLQTFALFLRMKRNEFCAIFFGTICAKPKIFFAKVAHETKFSFAQFAQNRKFYAKCNFLDKLSKIDILSLELKN